MFVCIYVVIYFRAWYDGCGREYVRIFSGSAPALCCSIAIASFIFAFNVYFTYSCVIGLATLVKVVAPGEG